MGVYRIMNGFDLNRTLNEKYPQLSDKRLKVILLHENEKHHATIIGRDTLISFQWEILVYLPDISPPC